MDAAVLGSLIGLSGVIFGIVLKAGLDRINASAEAKRSSARTLAAARQSAFVAFIIADVAFVEANSARTEALKVAEGELTGFSLSEKSRIEDVLRVAEENYTESRKVLVHSYVTAYVLADLPVRAALNATVVKSMGVDPADDLLLGDSAMRQISHSLTS